MTNEQNVKIRGNASAIDALIQRGTIDSLIELSKVSRKNFYNFKKGKKYVRLDVARAISGVLGADLATIIHPDDIESTQLFCDYFIRWARDIDPAYHKITKTTRVCGDSLELYMEEAGRKSKKHRLIWDFYPDNSFLLGREDPTRRDQIIQILERIREIVEVREDEVYDSEKYTKNPARGSLSLLLLQDAARDNLNKYLNELNDIDVVVRAATSTFWKPISPAINPCYREVLSDLYDVFTIDVMQEGGQQKYNQRVKELESKYGQNELDRAKTHLESYMPQWEIEHEKNISRLALDPPEVAVFAVREFMKGYGFTGEEWWEAHQKFVKLPTERQVIQLGRAFSLLLFCGVENDLGHFISRCLGSNSKDTRLFIMSKGSLPPRIIDACDHLTLHRDVMNYLSEKEYQAHYTEPIPF